jgi:hypothetical protein
MPSFIGDDDEIKQEKESAKIQVENDKVIENVLALFAGIFNQKKTNARRSS